MAHIIALQFQKSFLPHDPTPVSGQASIRSDYTVTRHDDADRIMPNRAADRLRGHLIESALLRQLVGDPPVCNRLSKRNPAHDLSDTVAEIGACQMDSREKAGVAARKVNVQPLFRLIKVVRFTPTSSFFQTKSGISGAPREPKTR